MEKPTIFICYHQKDVSWKDSLVSFMELLQQQCWTVDKIEAGEDETEKIAEAIGAARVAMFLVSSDSLNPQFIRRDEVSKLIARHKEGGLRVIPIIVRECPYEKIDWLARLRPLPEDRVALRRKKPADVDKELTKIAEAVARILDKLVTQTLDVQTPVYRPDSATQIVLSKLSEPESRKGVALREQLEDAVKRNPQLAKTFYEVGTKYMTQVAQEKSTTAPAKEYPQEPSKPSPEGFPPTTGSLGDQILAERGNAKTTK